MKLTLAFSPCPNDTFIFDALVNHKIDTGDFEFEVVLADVETLNQHAIEQRFDITKISYGVFHKLMNDYVILNSGSALGSGVGPLLISKNNQDSNEIQSQQIAIPGENTTANFLFSTAYPNAQNKIFLRYDEIEAFVLNDKGLGVIIHENRFTYADKGLHKIIDLGDFWETQTQSPIPLGGIVVKRIMDKAIQKQIDQLIQQSIEFAFSNYPILADYVIKNAQEMSEDVMRNHIDLYVNDFSISLGEKGRRAIEKMLNNYKVPVNQSNIFVD
ncbi:MAG: 1,4-dihydroxy-6-naphthoate synthase [Sphingobacteriales bacterium]|nr:1,4-dihydroxy-6-naphthoate synthase [Sphingobacteriales bacterium]